MSLITCPECGKQISDTVKKCPYCGVPLNVKKRLKIKNVHSSSDNTKPQNMFSKAAKKRIAIAGIIIAIPIVTSLGIEANKIHTYNTAIKLFNSGEYQDSSKKFYSLNDYQNSKEMYIESQYYFAKQLYDSKQYDKAIEIFKNIIDYKDSQTLIAESQFALELQNDSDPPVFSKHPTTITSTVGMEIDFEKWITDNAITAIDDVTGSAHCEIDATNYNPDKAGKYFVTLYAEDDVGNQAREEILVINKDIEALWLNIERTKDDETFKILKQIEGEQPPSSLPENSIGIYPLLDNAKIKDLSNLNWDKNSYIFLYEDSYNISYVGEAFEFEGKETPLGICEIPPYTGDFIQIGQQDGWKQLGDTICEYYYTTPITSSAPHLNGIIILKYTETLATGTVYSGYRMIPIYNGYAQIVTSGAIGSNEWPNSFQYEVVGYIDSKIQ